MKTLLGIGLAIIPFFILQGYDTREPKIYIALVLSLALFLLGLYNGIKMKVQNKWLLIIPLYLFITSIFIPKNIIYLNNIEAGGFWINQSLFSILTFLGLFTVIANTEFEEFEIETFLKIMMYSGLVISIYAILQGLSFDQFFVCNTVDGSLNLRKLFSGGYHERIGGTLGNPALLSSFIAIVFPLTLYFKRYYITFIMLFVLLIVNSNIAIGAVIFTLPLIIILNNKYRFYIYSLIVCLLCIFGLFLISHNPGIKEKLNDNYRMHVWKESIQDLNVRFSNTNYIYTGFGMGGFTYLFHARHPDLRIKMGVVKEAHNEFVEFTYNAGLIGLILLGIAILNVFNHFFDNITKRKKYLMMMFFSSILCACGLFIWHLGAHIFYTVVILGLIYNETKQEELNV